MKPSDTGHAPTVPGPPSNTHTVLVVDDSDDIRRLLIMLLDDEPDFDVVGEAANGRDAITQARELKPELVIIDNQMPVMNGLEAIPHIVEACDAAVVLFSSEGDTLAGRAESAGAAAALAKSTGVMTVVTELREILAARAASAADGGSSRA